MKPAVGLIGLGLMGRPMAANLLKAGFPLTVWNRTGSRAEALVAQGARAAKTPREAAAASDVLITIVSDPPAIEQVLWGAEGALNGLRSGSVLVDSSTVTPALARRVAAACSERNVEFVDAPVTGGTWGAEKGELVMMVGGAPETLARVEPILATLAKRWFHLGPHGAGQTVKLAMNLLLALEVDALAEATGFHDIRRQRWYRELNDDKACNMIDLEAVKRGALVVLTLVMKSATTRGEAAKAYFSKIRNLLEAAPLPVPSDIGEHTQRPLRYLSG